MSSKRTTLALGIASLIAPALLLTGCSSDSTDAGTTVTAASSASSAPAAPGSTTPAPAGAKPTLHDGTPFTGTQTKLAASTEAGAPQVSVSLPAGWTQVPATAPGLTDTLVGNTPEPSGFTPTVEVSITGEGSTSRADALAAARQTISTLTGWTEVKYTEIEVDGQQAFRLSGDYFKAGVNSPVYAVMTVIAYQADASSPVYLVKLANQYTDKTNLATSNQVEEINTSVTFG